MSTINKAKHKFSVSNLSGAVLLGRVEPDITKTFGTQKALAFLFFFLVPASFVVFLLGGIITGMTANLLYAPTMIIGISGIVVFGILGSFYASKAKKIKPLARLISEIKQRQRVDIDSLTLTEMIVRKSVVEIINKLIETKNLGNYKLIDETSVERTIK